MPLQRRVPKRGFTNIFKIKYQVISVGRLQKLVDDKKLTDSSINAVVLFKNKVISKGAAPYKILGDGELKSSLNVEAHAYSASAKEKIEAVGGSIKKIEA